MGRPAKISADGILDAALAEVAQVGAEATTAAVAERAGIRIGSLYYRFPNREVLLLWLWVRSIQRFQAVFLAAAASSPDPKSALVAAAVAIPRYCRDHPDEARALTLYRHHEVLAGLAAQPPEPADCPAELVARLRTLNDEVTEAMTRLTVALFGDADALDLVRVAVQQSTYGLVRPFIGPKAEPMPTWIDDVVAAVVPAALAIDYRR